MGWETDEPITAHAICIFKSISVSYIMDFPWTPRHYVLVYFHASTLVCSLNGVDVDFACGIGKPNTRSFAVTTFAR